MRKKIRLLWAGPFLFAFAAFCLHSAQIRSAPAGESIASGEEFYVHGMAAYRVGNYEEAVRLLSRVPRSHRGYARAMRFVGYNIYAREWKRPSEGLPYIHRSLAADPFEGNVWQDISRGYVEALEQSFR